MKRESYNDRKRLIDKYEKLDVELKKRIKEVLKHSNMSINPVRMYYEIINHLDTDEAISGIYSLDIDDVREIRKH